MKGRRSPNAGVGDTWMPLVGVAGVIGELASDRGDNWLKTVAQKTKYDDDIREIECHLAKRSDKVRRGNTTEPKGDLKMIADYANAHKAKTDVKTLLVASSASVAECLLCYWKELLQLAEKLSGFPWKDKGWRSHIARAEVVSILGDSRHWED